MRRMDQPPSELQSRHGGARVRFPPPFVFLALTLAGAALHWLRPLHTALGQMSHLAAGAVVGGSGFAFGLSAWLLFRRTGQDPAPWTPTPSLLGRGPYRYSRNPMYVGMTLLQAGLGLALDNLWMVLFAAVALVAVHYIAVLPEEAYLAHRFGADYLDYKSRVRRYL
jgi:protein-S-isoprenylcysteine O-methyltransferase Ste14